MTILFILSVHVIAGSGKPNTVHVIETLSVWLTIIVIGEMVNDGGSEMLIKPQKSYKDLHCTIRMASNEYTVNSLPNAPVLLAIHWYVPASSSTRLVRVNTLVASPVLLVDDSIVRIVKFSFSVTTNPSFSQTMDGTGRPLTVQEMIIWPAV